MVCAILLFFNEWSDYFSLLYLVIANIQVHGVENVVQHSPKILITYGDADNV